VASSDSTHAGTVFRGMLDEMRAGSGSQSSQKVVPVFVFENLHQHGVLSALGVPIQPLFEREEHVIVKEGIVMVLRVGCARQ
jgi:hypothetical protein